MTRIYCSWWRWLPKATHAPNFDISRQDFYFEFIKSVIKIWKINKYLTSKQGSLKTGDFRYKQEDGSYPLKTGISRYGIFETCITIFITAFIKFSLNWNISSIYLKSLTGDFCDIADPYRLFTFQYLRHDDFFFIISFHVFVISFHISVNCLTYSTSNTFCDINIVSIPVRRSIFTLVLFIADFFFYSLFKIDVTHIIIRLFIYNIPIQIGNDNNAMIILVQ